MFISITENWDSENMVIAWTIECMNDRKAFMDVGYALEIRAGLVSHTIINKGVEEARYIEKKSDL